jgi:hypothetical protein
MAGFVSGLADAASNLLGAGPPPPPKFPPQTPQFLDGGAIEDKPDMAGGAIALLHQNVFDPPATIQFIHFGYCHNDTSDGFPHGQMDDTDPAAIKGPAGTRAVMYRAALEREALLLAGFIGAVKDVVQECKGDQGALADVAGALSSLAGGGSNAAGPDPSQLDPFLSAVSAAAGPINDPAIKYPPIHKAGVDLQQARANYVAFAPTLNKGGSGGAAGLLGNLPGALPLPPMPGVSDVLSTVFGILFKMYDVYRETFFKLRADYEPRIEKGCYQRSMEAIRGRYEPIYDIWSLIPAADDKNKDKGPLDVSTGVSPVDKTVGDVNKDILDAESSWKDFWDNSPPDAPGQAHLNAILADVFKGSNELIVDAFNTGLLGSGHNLPDIVKTVLMKIASVNAGILQAIYQRLLDPTVARQLDETAFLAAGRKYLAGVLVGFVNDLLPSYDAFGLVNTGMATKKGGSMLDDKLGADIEPILKLAMGSVHDKLVAARQQADKTSSYTMEVFLALLPELMALMTRNTFFPIWQIIVEKVFGKGAAGAALATTPVRKLMDSGRDAASSVKDKAQDLDSSIKDKTSDAASSVADRENAIQQGSGGHLSDGSMLGTAANSLAGAAGGLADSVLGAKKPNGAGGGGKFPGDTRKTGGSAEKLVKADIDSVTLVVPLKGAK